MVVPPCRRLWDPRMSRLTPGPRRSPDGAPGTPICRKSARDPQLGALLIGTHTWVNHLRGPQDVARGPPDGIPPCAPSAPLPQPLQGMFSDLHPPSASELCISPHRNRFYVATFLVQCVLECPVWVNVLIHNFRYSGAMSNSRG